MTWIETTTMTSSCLLLCRRTVTFVGLLKLAVMVFPSTRDRNEDPSTEAPTVTAGEKTLEAGFQPKIPDKTE